MKLNSASNSLFGELTIDICLINQTSSLRLQTPKPCIFTQEAINRPNDGFQSGLPAGFKCLLDNFVPLKSCCVNL